MSTLLLISIALNVVLLGWVVFQAKMLIAWERTAGNTRLFTPRIDEDE